MWTLKAKGKPESQAHQHQKSETAAEKIETKPRGRDDTAVKRGSWRRWRAGGTVSNAADGRLSRGLGCEGGS